MKTKGVSILEQHVEKIVLALFTLFGLAIFVLQFDILGDPNAVKIGQRDGVAPENAVREVRTEAKRLEGEIDATVPADTVPDRQGPLAIVESLLAQPTTPEPARQLALLSPAEARDVGRPDGREFVGDGELRYFEIAPLAPTGVCAHVYAGAVDPRGLAEDARAALTGDQPLDMAIVSVQAAFDAADLRDQLDTVPTDPAIAALPGAWWIERVQILDVQLVRQRVDAAGEPVGDEELLPAMPGTESVRDQLTSDLLPRDLPGILNTERSYRADVRRPRPFPFIAGDAWLPPCDASARELNAEDRDRIAQLITSRGRFMREIERIQRRATGDTDRDRPTGGEDEAPRPPGGGRGFPPPAPGGPGGGNNDAAPSGLSERDQARLADLRAQADEIADTLATRFGVDPDGQPLAPDSAAGEERTIPSLTDRQGRSSITVWAHDLAPQPGAIYRYKLRVHVTNPMFGFLNQVAENQKELASTPVVPSEDSAWSEPVEVLPRELFFVDTAVTGKVIQGANLRQRVQATIDLYEFFYGFWRSASADVMPGDQLRATVALPQLPVVPEGEGAASGDTLPETREVALDAFLIDVAESYGREGLEVMLAMADGTMVVASPTTPEDDPLLYAVRRSADRGEATEIDLRRVPGVRDRSRRTPPPGPEGRGERRD